jgi:hypothetical protein
MVGQRWGVGSNQYQKRPGIGGTPQRSPAARSIPQVTLSANISFPETPGLIAARNALLDALEVLAPQGEALTVIGAQAVYEHTAQDLDVPPTSTEDGDFAVTPQLLVASPRVGDLLTAAGYVAKMPDRPGIWMKPENPRASIDLLVPEAFAGSKGRAARTPTDQGKNVIGRAAGIEMVLTDRDLRTLTALDGTSRSARTYVAGPAALLCAKSYKLIERINSRDTGKKDRVLPKDASDMWLLMASTDGLHIRNTFAVAEDHPAVGPAARQGRAYIERLFGLEGEAVELVIRSFGGRVPAGTIASTVSEWLHQFSA